MAIDLEKIAETGTQLRKISSLGRQIPNYASIEQEFYKVNDISPEEAPQVGDMPATLSAMNAQAEAKKRAELASQISGDLKSALSYLDKEVVIALAYNFSGDKEGLALISALQEGDDTLLRNTFASTLDKDSILMPYVARARPDLLEEAVKSNIENRQKQFADKYLSTEKDNKPEYNAERATDYLAEKIKALKDEERQSIYSQIGLYVASKKEKEDKAKAESQAKKK